MTYLFRFLTLVVLSLIGGLIVPVLFHLMIKFGLLNPDTAPEGFGNIMLEKATYVWMASVVIGLVGVFIKQEWRIALLLCPLTLPALFAVIYTIAKA